MSQYADLMLAHDSSVQPPSRWGDLRNRAAGREVFQYRVQNCAGWSAHLMQKDIWALSMW